MRLLLSASSEWHVVLGTVARVLVDAAHGVEYQHGDLGPGRVARERDARDGGADWRAADVPRSSFVQRLRDHVIVTPHAGAKFRMTCLELAVDLQHHLLQ